MPVRLGDDIDDYCIKCKRVMNHLIVSMMNDGPAKVRCKTCYSDHDFRHEQPPPPKEKKPPVIKQVLAVAGMPPEAQAILDGELPGDDELCGDDEAEEQ